MSMQRHFDNTPGYKDGRFTSLFQFRLSGHTAKWISSIHLPLDLAAHFNYMRIFANGIRPWCARTSRIDRFPDKVVGVDAVHDAIELISIEQHRGTKRNRKSRCRARNRANAATPNLLAVISRNCFPERCSLLAPATVFLPVPLVSSSSFSSSALH